MKKCSFCGSDIADDSIKCECCGVWVNRPKEVDSDQVLTEEEKGGMMSNNSPKWFLTINICVILYLALFIWYTTARRYEVTGIGQYPVRYNLSTGDVWIWNENWIKL